MKSNTFPTDEGRRRYVGTNGYVHPPIVDGEPVPCVCKTTCLRGCDGRCGCDACRWAFNVFADDLGWTTEGGLLIDLDEALQIYGQMFPPVTIL